MSYIPAEKYKGYYNRIANICKCEWIMKDTLMFILHQYIMPIIGGCTALGALIICMIALWHDDPKGIPYNAP